MFAFKEKLLYYLNATLKFIDTNHSNMLFPFDQYNTKIKQSSKVQIYLPPKTHVAMVSTDCSYYRSSD